MSRRSDSTSRNTRAGTAGLEQRVLARFRRIEFDDGPLLIGFSGGPDSLALSSVLSRIRPWLNRELIAVHVDHGLRSSSGADAIGAAALAATLDLRCEVVQLTAADLHRHVGVGIEEAARRERYRALARVATNHGARLVVLGHQRDDQAETVLLHLLRGSGIGGAAGMAELTERLVPWWPEDAAQPTRLRIWRPLLPESRSTLLRYLQRLGLRPIVDDSNSDPRFRRNAIRQRALPCLEEISPGAAEALARFASLAADDDALLDQLTDERVARCVIDGQLDAEAVGREAVSLQRRLIRRWLIDRDNSLELNAERVEAVRLLVLTGQGRSDVELGADKVVHRVGSRLVLVRRECRLMKENRRR